MFYNGSSKLFQCLFAGVYVIYSLLCSLFELLLYIGEYIRLIMILIQYTLTPWDRKWYEDETEYEKFTSNPMYVFFTFLLGAIQKLQKKRHYSKL